jgi:pimeloyl-ACP methyl ester carboxylesterase
VALLTLADGRRLHYEMAGPHTGRWLVFHHGTPGAALAHPGHVDVAAAAGLGTILVSRPGYAGSSAKPGRHVADVAGDVAVLLDHLGVERFVTAGWSGGGPHALATGAALPGRCAAVACLAGVAPYDAAGIDWVEGMGADNLEEFAAAAAGPEALEAYLRPAAAALHGADGPRLLAELASLLPPVDLAAAGHGLADHLAALFAAALAAGIDGWRDDDLAFLSPWGFEPAALAGTPTSVWYGDADLMVPPSHGAWLARAIPGVEVRHLPAEGHVSLLDHLGEVAAWLAERLPVG